MFIKIDFSHYLNSIKLKKLYDIYKIKTETIVIRQSLMSYRSLPLLA